MDSSLQYVRAITVFFLLYFVCIDWSESIWYAESSMVKTDLNIGTHVDYMGLQQWRTLK